jgi:hypothetical protein
MNAQIQIKQQFCTGLGQFDTHKNDGQTYQSITGAEIAAMVIAPPSLDKAKAQWLIPSTYAANDARSHEAQRQHGEFWFLPLDVDVNNLARKDIEAALASVLGNVSRLIYTTRSSTETNRKWRALIPLRFPVAGADYHETVTAFYDLLEDASQGALIPDRALARPGQLVYLPNRGQHYEHEINKAERVTLSDDHKVIQRRDATRQKRIKAEAKAAAWSEAKARQAPTDASSIVDAFNQAHEVADLLVRYGFTQAGSSNDYRSPFQSSGSYATRCYGSYWISLSASDAAQGLGKDTKTGQRFGDAFDLFVYFDHSGGDAGFKAAIKSYAQEIGRDYKTLTKAKRKDAANIRTTDADPIAATLAKRIIATIKGDLDLSQDPLVDVVIVQNMIEGAFWSGAKSRMFLLNETECLVQFVLSDTWKFLCRRFGNPIDADEIMQEWEKENGKPSSKDQIKLRKVIHTATIGLIIDYLKYENQRDAVEWSVDMFGSKSRLELKENVARIVLTHQPLVAEGNIDQACVADYRSHFPLIDEMLEYIVAGRFALDRKKAYLWMFAASDWGKGFLMGALTDLGLVVQMSVKEIEAVFEGKPAGRKPEDFKRAMILAVDEFKAVKSELKQLQSEIHLAPKFQLTARVEIFTKLFLSAESVGSLVGENGVEDQFANRMSMLTGSGTLNERDVYKADQSKYYRSVRAYVGQELNRLIADYIEQGREGAEKKADNYLNDFIGRHGLDQHFERLSESYPAIAGQAISWMRSTKILQTSSGHEYLTYANKALDDYFSEHYGVSEVGTLRRRKTEIMALMSEDGRGNASYRIHGRVVKALKLKTL